MTRDDTTEPRRVWRNGELIAWEAASIHLLSHAVQRGSLVFDAVRVFDTPDGPALFRLADHVARFRLSCEQVGMALEHDVAELSAAAVELLHANVGADKLKLCAYHESLEDGLIPRDARVTVAILAYGRDPGTGPTRSAAQGVRLKLEPGWHLSTIVPTHAKIAGRYVSAMIAKAIATREGYDDVLLLDGEGNALEALNSNLFLVDVHGTLHTPAAQDVLAGVTRACVIDLARSAGIELVERPLRPSELFEAREVFLTGTSSGLNPVVSVNDRSVGTDGAGEITLQLDARLDRARHGLDPEFQHWLTLCSA